MAVETLDTLAAGNKAWIKEKRSLALDAAFDALAAGGDDAEAVARGHLVRAGFTAEEQLQILGGSGS